MTRRRSARRAARRSPIARFARSSRTSPSRSRRRALARAIASASCSTTARRWRPRFWRSDRRRPRRRSTRPIAPTNSSSISPTCDAKLLVVAAGQGLAGGRRRAEARAFRSRGSCRIPSAARARSRSTFDGGPADAGGARARRDAGRHRARAAHVGHDVASEDRAARAQEHRGVGGEHSQHARAHGERSRPRHHAAVPHSRPDRRAARRRSRPAARCAARRASTRSSSSPGSTK